MTNELNRAGQGAKQLLIGCCSRCQRSAPSCCELDYKGMDLSFVRFSLSTRPLAWAFVTQINNKHEFPHRPDRNPDCRSTCRLLTRANVTSLAGSSLVSRMRRCLAE